MSIGTRRRRLELDRSGPRIRETPGVSPTDPPADVPLAVILAAGGGSRFTGDGHKLLATADGRPVAQHALDAAVRSEIGPVLVVTGAVDLADVISAVEAEHPDARITPVANPRWVSGQATSLAVAIEAAIAGGHESVVIGLADQPLVEPASWQRVAASASPIAVAMYAGRRGNPVRLAKEVWPLLPSDGDEGARGLIRLRPDLVEEIPCVGSAADIDTWEDLRAWQNRSSTSSP